MAKREKVVDIDPLSSFTFDNSSNEQDKKSKVSVQPVFQTDEKLVIPDFSKVKTKDNPKPTNTSLFSDKPTRVENQDTKAEIGNNRGALDDNRLGLGVNQFNSMQQTFTTPKDDWTKINIDQENSSDSLLFKPQETNKNNLNFTTFNTKRTLFDSQNENKLDDKIDDLLVSNLLEREEASAQTDLFGNTKTKVPTSKNTQQNQTPSFLLDSSLLNDEGDELFKKLESATISSNPTIPKKTDISVDDLFNMINSNSNDVVEDPERFDFSAYIQQQSSNKSGSNLFS